jgi:hypothetical protein
MTSPPLNPNLELVDTARNEVRIWMACGMAICVGFGKKCSSCVRMVDDDEDMVVVDVSRWLALTWKLLLAAVEEDADASTSTRRLD